MSKICTISDNGNGIITILFENGFTVVIDCKIQENSIIQNPAGKVIYRGIISFTKERDLSSAYIKLTDYISPKQYQIPVSEIGCIPMSSVILKNKNTLEINQVILNSVIRIVEMPPYGLNDFNTDNVIIEKTINSIPHSINLPEDCNEKNYVVWINKDCSLINLK